VLKTHNGRRWICEAIDSVFRQTYTNWHLTIVDDASTDGTIELLRSRYENEASRISLIPLAENRGPTGAQLVGIRSTSGDVLAFIDADDEWHPRKLEFQVLRLQREPFVHAVHTDVRRVDAAGEMLESSTARDNEARAKIPFDRFTARQLALALFPRHVIANGTAVILRDAYERARGYDESLSGAADFEFWVRFAASGHRIGHLPQLLYARRVHENRFTTTNRLALADKRIAAVDKLVAEYPFLRGLEPERKEGFLREKLRWSLEAGEGATARRAIKELAQLGQMSPKMAAAWTVSWCCPLAKPVLHAYSLAAGAMSARGEPRDAQPPAEFSSASR